MSVPVGPVGVDGAEGADTVTLLVPEKLLQPTALQALTWYCHVPALFPVTALLRVAPSWISVHVPVLPLRSSSA